jgi:hypothetical protein
MGRRTAETRRKEMSILIKDMEMPKYGCDHCFLRTGNYCGMIEKNEIVVEYAKKSERHPDCPLVPVPSHYDLIDHNALKIAVMDCDVETRIDFLKHAMDCINKAPVVIPSDMPTYEEEGEW